MLKERATLLPDQAHPGEVWMIDAGGQRGAFTVGPRGIVMPQPNAGSLIDFGADVMRGNAGLGGGRGGGAGGAARATNWSDDGQPPSALQTTQLAGAT
jgi:hypothetical protein